MTIAETTKLTERVAVIETKLDSIEKKMDEFIASADLKYADKDTEKFVNRLKSSGTYIITGILMAILALLINHVLPDLKINL